MGDHSIYAPWTPLYSGVCIKGSTLCTYYGQLCGSTETKLDFFADVIIIFPMVFPSVA